MRRILFILLIGTFLSACTSTGKIPVTAPNPAKAQLLGVMDVQIANSADLVMATAQLSSQSLLSGLMVERVSSSFADVHNTRYLSVTFRFINNTSSTIHNLSLYALTGPDTVGGTAIKNLYNATHTPFYDVALARAILPTHKMQETAGGTVRLASLEEANFQAYLLEELRGADGIQAQVDALQAGMMVLPYGYVGRNSTAKRSIAPGTDGFVTVAVQFPYTTTDPAADPFGFSMMFAIGDETTERFTQGPYNTESITDFWFRVSSYYGGSPPTETKLMITNATSPGTAPNGNFIFLPNLLTFFAEPLPPVTYQRVRWLPSHSTLLGTLWSPDGASILTFDSSSIGLWDAATGDARHFWRLRESFNDRNISGVAWHPDSSKFAVATENEGRVYNASSGALLLTLTGSDTFKALAFSPDGTRIVVSFGNRLTLFNAHSGANEGTIGQWIYEDYYARPTWSPDGSSVFIFGDGAVRQYHEDGSLLRSFATATPQFAEVPFAVSPDGTTLAIVNGSARERLELRRVHDGSVIWTLEETRSLRDVQFSPSGQQLAFITDSEASARPAQVQVVNVEDGSSVAATDIPATNSWPSNFPLLRLSWNATGTHLVTLTKAATGFVWDVRTGEKTLDLGLLPGTLHNLDIDANERLVAVGGGLTGYKTVATLDLRSGARKTMPFLDALVYYAHVKWLAGSDRVAGVSIPSFPGPNYLKVWDTQTGAEVFTHSFSATPERVIWTEDGSKFAYYANSAWTIMETQTAQVLFTLPDTGFTELAWRPDAQELAVSSSYGTLRVFDGQSGQPLRTLSNIPYSTSRLFWLNEDTILLTYGSMMVVVSSLHGRVIKQWLVSGNSITLQPSPDGRMLVFSTRDRNFRDVSIEVVNLLSGQPLLSIPQPNVATSRIVAFAWSDDSTRLGVGHSDGKLEVFNLDLNGR